MILLSINFWDYFLIRSINWLFYNMSEMEKDVDQCHGKPKMMSSNILFYLQLTDDWVWE